MFRRVYRAAEAGLHAVAFAGIAALLVAVGVVVFDIVWRRLTAQSMIGTVDLTQLCVMAAAFGAIPYTFIRGGHVSLDIVTDCLPRRARGLLDGIAALIGLAVVGLLTWLAWDQAMLRVAYGDVSQNLRIPMIWYWGLLLAGGALSCIATLLVALRAFSTAFDREDGAAP